jgi:hypothetical protein
MGGRLYSQGDRNYQQMHVTERLKMTIDGAAVCELDVRASYMTIFHAQHGQPLDPARDPYELLGRGEEGRDVVKGFLTRTFGNDEFPGRWSSKLASDFLEDHGKKLGKQYPLHHVRDVVEATYPLLAELQPDAWAPLMFLESEAILTTMLALMERGIPSLSMHDSLIVPQRHATAATVLLRTSYEATTAATPFIRCRLP